MKVPLRWLEKYIKIKHSPSDFGKIMTSLEFMQDGAPKELGGTYVVDLEVRQNRPDILSIIGVAREYAAFLNEKIQEPDHIDTKEKDIDWGKPEILIRVEDKEVVQRFCAIDISDIKIAESPDWLKQDLESYGLPSINNIVDITNYVMLEYGIPMHAFDKSKLAKAENTPLLTLRKAESGEKFTTWQDTHIDLTIKDTVVADAEKAVAIAGIIGGANSDIDENTKEIILEAACYDQAAIRRTSIRHNIRTEASSRHEKFLNPSMVKVSVLRALFLIEQLATGKIQKIEDFYQDTNILKEMEFNLNEVSRLSGVVLDSDEIINYLNRLGFEIIEHIEAIGINRDILVVRIPKWRTDINYEADLVEEVLRIYGYEKIALTPLSSLAPDYGTPKVLILEDKVKDILVNLGLCEQILSPFVKSDEVSERVLIENPLNRDNEALRLTIRETLAPVAAYYTKAGKDNVAIFESGKIFKKVKAGEYTEERLIETLYISYDYKSRVKPDFINLINKLGLNNASLNWKKTANQLDYYYDTTLVGTLFSDGYKLFIENVVELVDVNLIPFLDIKTSLTQQILEDITLNIPLDESIGKIAESIKESSEYIKHISVKDIFKDQSEENTNAVTLEILFEDIQNKLSREKIEEIRQEFLNSIKRFNAQLKIKK